MQNDAMFFYVMLALPSMFGLSLICEGMYKSFHYQSGWINMFLGTTFLMIVAFGYFYLRSYIK